MYKLLRCLTLCLASSLALAEPCIRLAAPQFKPFTYSEYDLVLGLGAERVALALNSINQPYQFVSVPNYGRALRELKASRVDGFFLATENEERNRYGKLSAAVIINHWSWFWLKQDSSPDASNFRSEARIGTILNTNTHRWLEESGYTVSAALDDIPHLIALLEKGRIDAIFLAELAVKHELKERATALNLNQKIEKSIPMGVYVSHRFSEANPGFAERFDQAIRVLPAIEEAQN